MVEPLELFCYYAWKKLNSLGSGFSVSSEIKENGFNCYNSNNAI